MDDKLGPMQLPKMPEQRRRDELLKAKSEIERAIEVNRTLAAVVQAPQWPLLKSLVDTAIADYTKALIRESDRHELYRLQGAVRALSAFSASPEGAAKLVEKLRLKHDEISKALG